MTVRAVPLMTASPSGLVFSVRLPDDGSIKITEVSKHAPLLSLAQLLTSKVFLYFIHDQIHQLIVPFEQSDD
jgi:hypothetical protein